MRSASWLLDPETQRGQPWPRKPPWIREPPSEAPQKKKQAHRPVQIISTRRLLVQTAVQHLQLQPWDHRYLKNPRWTLVTSLNPRLWLNLLLSYRLDPHCAGLLLWAPRTRTWFSTLPVQHTTASATSTITAASKRTNTWMLQLVSHTFIYTENTHTRQEEKKEWSIG